MDKASDNVGAPAKERKKKERTPERQKEIDDQMKEIHAEQDRQEKQLRQEIKAKADKAVMLYKARRGRPPVYDDSTRDEIIWRMSNGQSLSHICESDNMPDPATVLDWVEKDTSFGHKYRRAREHQSDVLFNQCLDIADDTSNDTIKNELTGEKTANNAAIQRDRLRIETRFRMAGKLSLRYHDKPPVIGEGANVTVNSLNINARDMTPEARDKLRAILIEAKNNVRQIDG